ncbi:hypothetical protein ncot_13270 [Nocardioides sp. JQ2195]|uniref:hypothetical protein n=1 Tax=Nocardioides sp. JQ2195 TaxID=2592334 RepID=UPI00143E39F9|nr:hypothetical protein [Nocardioides sp. JQ2195]QIX27469.1 hypothetical protein ncot_13270 [Nocardioides sp. JQ2195]
MATRAEFEQTMLDKLTKMAEGASNSTQLLKLAETYAWLVSPGQPHGGEVHVTK